MNCCSGFLVVFLFVFLACRLWNYIKQGMFGGYIQRVLVLMFNVLVPILLTLIHGWVLDYGVWGC